MAHFLLSTEPRVQASPQRFQWKDVKCIAVDAMPRRSSTTPVVLWALPRFLPNSTVPVRPTKKISWFYIRYHQSPVLRYCPTWVGPQSSVWGGENKMVLFIVTFQLRQHIGTTRASPIKKRAISANDFYWSNALTIWYWCDVYTGCSGMPQSSPI